ncbi:MAG: PEP-CTERM sorting domain-containing protein, partial [Planctomycetaceae bacterium]
DSRQGTFQITGPDSFGDLRLVPQYTATGLTIHTVFPGDATLDGVVDDVDLQIVQQNLGMSDATWTEGDFTGNGQVGLRDAFLLAQHYGATPTSVPEPGSLILLGLGGLLLMRRRAA